MHARDAMKERSDSSRGVDGRSGPCWFISGLGGDGEIEPLEVVRAENRIHGSDQHSCSPGTLPVMLTGHVPAVPFPPDHAGHRVAAAVPARGCVEDRRDLDPAPPAPGPAPPVAGEPEAGAGGPGPARGPARRDTKARRHGLRLLVTPDTILRWHRDIVRRRWATRSKRGRTGRHGTSRK